MTLFRNNQPLATIFDVLGSSENDMTAGLAFVLSRSPQFQSEIVKLITGGKSIRFRQPTIHIQTSRRGEGITDIEFNAAPDFFAVFEAKRGPNLPGRRQLECYAPVVARSDAKNQFLVTVSNATDELAKIHFSEMNIRRVPLRHLSWRAVRQAAASSSSGESNANKQLLAHFIEYLTGLLEMDVKYSNKVYVVSLAKGNQEGWKISWIDIVEKRNRYFYPISTGGWPDPPNYLGFRYDGKLQSIRRVVSYETTDTPRTVFPEAPNKRWALHYVLKLGPPIIPQHEIRNGPNIHRANRCWCMIDALLTASTISEALAETKRREEEDS